MAPAPPWLSPRGRRIRDRLDAAGPWHWVFEAALNFAATAADMYLALHEDIRLLPADQVNAALQDTLGETHRTAREWLAEFRVIDLEAVAQFDETGRDRDIAELAGDDAEVLH